MLNPDALERSRLEQHHLESLAQGRHGDPFAVLGPHAASENETVLRAFLPGAQSVQAIEGDSKRLIGKLNQVHSAGIFERSFKRAKDKPYRLRIVWGDGQETIEHDPYRFAPLLSDLDIWLLSEGTHLRPYEVLGAHPVQIDGVDGVRFAVWAPNASRVSVVGSFNFWDGRRHPMRLRAECGVWEMFIPALAQGELYKYEIRAGNGDVLPARADPYAQASEMRPATASRVCALQPKVPASQQRQQANGQQAPISIYEVHLGSWQRRTPDTPEAQAALPHGRWLNWDELADSLIPYAIDMGFTHLELMPIHEHPFDGSWGYQPIGLYSPTARFGDAAGCARFVARCHEQGLGVLLDWVPAHFPNDAHGLGQFDGTALYEYADPREGFHKDWKTLIYNFGRNEVRSYLLGNSLYWLERFGVDGLRVDAVSSMLYRDYSREAGEWIPNHLGGRENLEAISLFRRMNEVVGQERPEAITVAEESTSFPAVSRPTYAGGLGFHYKWNMGWMHDTLSYMARDPIHRKHHHNQMSFGMVYAYSENFVLPISHDEVVHGKGSLLNKMPGDPWQKFANLRAYLGFMFAHPGKKLLFMGCEFGQWREWNHDQSLDWHLLEQPEHAGLQRWVRDLNQMYRSTPALYQQDGDPAGFQWIEANDAQHSVLSFLRRGLAEDSIIIAVSNFTPTPHQAYRLGVPRAGTWQERLNSDSAFYGGSNVGTPYGMATASPQAWQGQPHSIQIDLPPLATVFLEWKG